MSHWAQLDENNKVINVLVGDNNDPNGDEGYKWLIDNIGGTWIKTSYNAATNGFRYNYAGIGFTYDADADAFIAPRPTCGHKELFLNDQFKWNCQRCELDAKALYDANQL
jgi:hypothetical protein